jgi:hypothetical protein
VTAVVGLCNAYPCFTHRAGTQGAVCSGPREVDIIPSYVGSTGGLRKRAICRIVVLLGVARALVVRTAGTVAGASVRTVCLSEAQCGQDGDGEEFKHCCCC